LLFHILRTNDLDSVLVFARTKHGADKISRKLERAGFKAVAIHSNRTQAQRQRALAGFKQGQYKIMVATDIAARGIDVEGISHVVNYDTPAFAEDYIHRIGRTGRASASGDAITFVSGPEQKYFKGIERFTGRQFELKRYPNFDYAKHVPTPAVPEAPNHQQDRPEEERRRPEHRHEDRRKPEHRHGDARKSDHRHEEHRNSERRHVPREMHSSEQRRGERPRRSDQARKAGHGDRRRANAERSRDHREHTKHPANRRHEEHPPDRHEHGGTRHPHAVVTPRFGKRESGFKPAPQESDWRSLVSAMEQAEGSVRKKIKRLFSREK